MKRNFLNKIISSKNFFTGYYFIFPAIFGCFLFIIIPSIFSFLLSFFDWNLINDLKFCSLSNYLNLFDEPNFWIVLNNTLFYALSVTILGTIFPLLLASILYQKIKYKDFFKTSYFLPFVTPMIVIALLWQWIFDPNIGFVNTLLKSNVQWLYDSKLAMSVLIIVSVWKLIGYNMIIYLSGFSSINSELYEAANIDGANNIKGFFYITLPLLSPTIFFVVLITTISSFQVFDLIYLMTQGGPENSTNVLVYWLYKNAFEFFNIGKASAIAYILFLFIFLLTIVQWVMRTKWVLNEKD